MALQFDTQEMGGSVATASAANKSWNISFNRKVSVKDRMFFTEQLALLLETGTSLHPALVSIRAQMTDSPMAGVIDQIAEGVLGGSSLSEQLAEHPEVFSSTYVSLVAASEQGGFMHEVLEQLQKMDEQNTELRSALVSAFSYPAFLVVFSIFALVFILVVVFPKFAQMFASIGDALPTSTKVLMGVSDFLIMNWVWVVAATVGAIALLIWWARSPGGKIQVAHMKLYLPGIGKIWRRVYLVVSFRVLGLSLKNGVSLVDGVRTSKDVIDNARIRHFFVELSSHLEGGGRLSDGIADAGWMPDLAKQMLTTAEESGSLPQVLLRVSDYYHRELDRLLQRVSKMIEPIMLVVMGVLVGLLVSSLLLPIFKMSQAVG